VCGAINQRASTGGVGDGGKHPMRVSGGSDDIDDDLLSITNRNPSSSSGSSRSEGCGSGGGGGGGDYFVYRVAAIIDASFCAFLLPSASAVAVPVAVAVADAVAFAIFASVVRSVAATVTVAAIVASAIVVAIVVSLSFLSFHSLSTRFALTRKLTS
jgi:hypothetical protein